MTHEYTLLAIQQLAQLISIRRENVSRWGKATPPHARTLHLAVGFDATIA